MTQTCERAFDEALLSGYLDSALNQAEAQKIRIHLEDCADCSSLYEELQALRDAARGTSFKAPDETEWPELPQTRLSWLGRFLGWAVMISWLVVVSGLALYRFLASAGDPFEVFLRLGLPGAFLLLFCSVLLDRVRDLKSDRYRGIQR